MAGLIPINRMIVKCTHKQLALGFLCMCFLLVVYLVNISLFYVSWARLGTNQAYLKRIITAKLGDEVDLSNDEDTYVRDDAVPQTNCPNGIWARVPQTEFKAQFLRNVPVILWLKHVSKEEHDRLRKYPGAHGWRGVSFLDLVDTISALNTTANRVMFDDWDQRAKGSSCIRCAVIGNGGILRGSGKGQEIDQHHYIFRVNGAVINGFEQDVGYRTSFYTFSTNTLRNSLNEYTRLGFKEPPKSEETRYIFLPDQGRDYSHLKAAASQTKVKNTMPSKYFGKNVTAEKFKIYHPDFVRYIQNRFLRSPILKTKHKSGYRPTTGAVMLMAAIHTCDQVNAYGFITPNYKNYSYHYYDKDFKKVIFYSNHDFSLEMKVWQELHKAGLINLYMRE